MGKTTLRINFTKRAIEQIPAPRERRALYYDTQTRGLGVMIQPSGHRAFFWFRKVRGRPTWKTIGQFPEISIEQARAAAARLSSQTAEWKSRGYDGDDPFRRRRDLTLGQLFDDYVERRLKVHAKNPDRATRLAKWQFGKHLASWRDLKLGSIRRADVRALHAEIGDASGKVMANRIIQLIRTIFSWAGKVELWRGENPARGITPYAESSRTRFLLPNELPRLFKALSTEKNRDLRDFVLLALFTGARRSDLMSMRWDGIDLKRGLWVVPDPKSRVPYTVPLMDEAVTILKMRRADATKKRREESLGEAHRPGGEIFWVFPSSGMTGHLTELKRSWSQLLKKAKISGLRIHDLRRTLGSWQAAAGVSLPVIGKTLGHQSIDATEIYARLQLDPVRAAIASATDAMFAAGRVPKRKLLTDVRR